MTYNWVGHPAAAPQHVPLEHGLLGWTCDPDKLNIQSNLANGFVYLMKMWLPLGGLANRIWYDQQSTLVTPVANGNWMGIYDSTGARVAQTAALDAAWQLASAGPVPVPLAAPVFLSPGFYWAAFLGNATTPVNLAWYQPTNENFKAARINVNLPANNSQVRGGYLVTGGKTALPANFNPATDVGQQGVLGWAAVD